MDIVLLAMLLVQISSITLAVGYLGNFLKNKKYQLISLIILVSYLFLYEWINIITTVLLWCVLCLITYFTKKIFMNHFYILHLLCLFIFLLMKLRLFFTAFLV